MASVIYNAIMIPNLLLGVPRNWFACSGLVFAIPWFFFNEKILGMIAFGFMHFIGYMLTKYVDPDFVNILFKKLEYFDWKKVFKGKIYND